MCFFLFFFFKQKTAYEMRISDWSSDVCSSDLMRRGSPYPRGFGTVLLLQRIGHASEGVLDDLVDRGRRQRRWPSGDTENGRYLSLHRRYWWQSIKASIACEILHDTIAQRNRALNADRKRTPLNSSH